MRGHGRVDRPLVGRAGLLLGLGSALVISACAYRPLEKMLARGEYEAVVARAGSGKRAPKRRAARAYASALAALDRVEEARTVLLRDFRTSGDVASMVALADLEAERGIFGMAVAHYSRAATLDPESVAGRGDVCEFLRRRAVAYLAEGEALAADQDLRRLEVLCPSMSGSAQGLADAALATQVRAEAAAAAKLLRTLQGCESGQCVVGRSARAGATTDDTLARLTPLECPEELRRSRGLSPHLGRESSVGEPLSGARHARAEHLQPTEILIRGEGLALREVCDRSPAQELTDISAPRDALRIQRRGAAVVRHRHAKDPPLSLEIRESHHRRDVTARPKVAEEHGPRLLHPVQSCERARVGPCSSPLRRSLA